MPRPKRSDLVIEGEIQLFRCVYTCMRYCRLAGKHPVTNRSCEHRKEWVAKRLKNLSELFAIECLVHLVGEEEVEIVIRTRPDLAKKWTDRQVAERWCSLFPRSVKGKSPKESQAARLSEILGDEKYLGEIRRRLSDISWYMRCFAEHIAAKANKEEDAKGRFWAGRFKPTLLLDAPALLATTVAMECDASLNKRTASKPKRLVKAPLLKSSPGAPSDGDADRFGSLPENQGHYSKLTEWTRNQIWGANNRSGSRIARKIFRQFGMTQECWLNAVKSIRTVVSSVAGKPENIKHEILKHSDRHFFRVPDNPLNAIAG